MTKLIKLHEKFLFGDTIIYKQGTNITIDVAKSQTKVSIICEKNKDLQSVADALLALADAND
jgi:hypothetical protein